VEGADITHADTNLLAAGGVGGGDILKEFMRLAIDDPVQVAAAPGCHKGAHPGAPANSGPTELEHTKSAAINIKIKAKQTVVLPL